MKLVLLGVAVAAVAVGASVLVRVPDAVVGNRPGGEARGLEPRPPRWADVPPEPPRAPIDVVFIHHSVGGALLAEPGPEAGPHAPQAIYDTHPSGAAFRRAAERAGYRVHQASYGSLIGERIDLFDWLPTFGTNMDRVLRTRFQDELLPEGKRNRVVMFETCFNSNWFRELGEEPGRSSGPELTVANGKAVFRELRSIFERHPDVLFVHLTATPLAPRLKGEALWKAAARFAAGKPSQQANLTRAAELSREFNTWLADPEGWLAGYPLKNIAVFDYYDVMTGYGRTDALLYPADGAGYDAHPGPEGQRAAADALLPFLNRAVRRAGVDGAAQ